MVLKEAVKLFESKKTSPTDEIEVYYNECGTNHYVSSTDTRLANVPVLKCSTYKTKCIPMSIDLHCGKEYQVKITEVILDGRECCKALNRRYYNHLTKCLEEWNGEKWVVRPRKVKRG